jgi:hemerythrin
MILWTKQFETGDEQLDHQHQKLIENINQLEEQLYSTNPTRKEIEFTVQLVDYLESYANIHFQGEEGCMHRHRCPIEDVNQREHERFRGYMQDYRRRCESEGFRLELLRSLHQLIASWITNHILKIDTQLRACMPPSRRTDPGEAAA